MLPIYYIDIAVDHGIGTRSGLDTSNYMGWLDAFQPDVDAPEYWVMITSLRMSGCIFRMRGSRDLSGNSKGFWGLNCIFTAWDPVTYGPWRFYLDYTPDPMNPMTYVQFNQDIAGLEGGIIQTGGWVYVTCNGPLNLRIINTLIYSKGSSTFSRVILSVASFGCQVTLKGSRLSIDTELASPYKAISMDGYGGGSLNINAQDTVFEGNIEAYGTYSLTANRCAFSNAPGFGTLTNCQTNFVATNPLPAYNAAQVAWSATTINAGIATPPEPGTVPYDGYYEGLWGFARTGISAADFPQVSKQISVFPKYYTYGTVATASTNDLSVIVSNFGTSSITAGTISGYGASFSVLNDNVTGQVIPSMGTATFTLRYAPSAAGNHGCTIQISSDDLDRNPYEITIDAEAVVPNYSFSYNTDPVDYGTVGVGSTSEKWLNVTYTGNLPITLGQLTTEPPFNIVAEEDSLSNRYFLPGYDGYVQVNFSPAAGGPVSGALSIPSTSPLSPNLLTLLGVGFQPAGTQYTRPDYDIHCSDTLEEGVSLSRANEEDGLFNSGVEDYYDSDDSPKATEWSSVQEDDNLDPTELSYDTWGENVYTGDLVGGYVYMHTLSTDQYYKFQFTSWNDDRGFGFSYFRSIWNGSWSANVEFTCPDNVQPDHIHVLTPAFHLARRNIEGLYNAAVEVRFDKDTRLSPLNTEWSNPQNTEVSDYKSLDYVTWQEAVTGEGYYPPMMVNNYMYVRVPSEDRYFVLAFTHWTQGEGGGYTYFWRELTNPVPPVPPAPGPTDLAIKQWKLTHPGQRTYRGTFQLEDSFL